MTGRPARLAGANHPLLRGRHPLDRQLDAQIAARHHDRVGGGDDRVDRLQRLLLLDLRHQRQIGEAARLGDVALVPDVGQRDEVGRQDADVGQVARDPCRSAPAATTCRAGRLIPLRDRSVPPTCTRQHTRSAPHLGRLRDRWSRPRCRRDRRHARARRATGRPPARRRPQHDRVAGRRILISPGRSPSRSLGPPRSASTATSGRWARARATRAACSRGRRMRQVHAQHVHPRIQQPLQRALRVLRRSDRGDDLGPTVQHDRHSTPARPASTGHPAGRLSQFTAASGGRYLAET